MSTNPFPRGRLPREATDVVLGGVKRKKTSKSPVEKDFLFGESKRTKSSSRHSDKSKSTTSLDSSTSHSKAISGLPLGGGQVVHLKKDAIIEALSFKSLDKGTKLLGVVREVNRDVCLVSLPSHLTGYILPSKSEAIPLTSQLSEGQMLAVYVVKVASEQIGKEKQQVKRIQLSVDPHHLNNTVDDFSQHVTLRGRIKSVEDHGVLVDLGNGRQGFCKFSNVEGDYVIETDEDASPGTWMLNEGRILDFILEDKAKVNLKSRVVSLCLTKSLAERVDPSSYHPMLQDLNPGSLVSCKIDALARNGLLVSFAVFRGAIHVNHLGANWIPTNKQGSDTEWKAVFADVRNFTARIIAVDVRTKLIRLSIQPHILTLSEQPTLPAVGTVIEDSTVIRLDPGIGALLSLPPIETPIKVTIPSLRKNESYCEAVQRPAVYVHISKTTAGRIVEVDFAREYAPSTRHKVRILSTSHLLDGTATGATAPNIVNAHVLQHSDLVIGKVYRNVPVYGNLEGGSVLVDFGMGIHGLIPVIHLFDKSNMTADHMSKLRKEKFALGNKVDVRILSLDSKMKRCIVTAKKNLIKATDCITDFSDLQTNQRITGYISRIDDSCLYVTFFNKVYGRVTAKSLVAELGIEDHRIDYSVGDVVKCRVVSCRRRIGKSLDTYAEEDIDETGSENRNHGFWDLNLSLNVGDTETNNKEGLNIVEKIEVRSGEILSPNSMKVIDLIPSIDRKRGEGFIPGHAIVRVLSSLVTTEANDKSYIECKVPYDHILDSYDEKDVQSKEAMDEFAKLFFKIGKKIDTEGIILFDPKKSKDEYASGIGKLPVVSLRHKMIDQARKNKEIGSEKNTILIPSGETNLFVGALVLGVVHQSDPRFGAFIKFLDNLTGLIPNTKKGKSMKKWETVLCKVVALDVTAQPPKILLQKASVKATSISSIEIPIKVGDKIGAAEVIDTDLCRALLKIKDSSLDSFGKLQARIHVSMVQSTPIAIPRYKKGIGNSQSDAQAKAVPKSHPFYGWKQGTVLKDLVCVSTHSNHGTLFVELSNRIGVCKNPSLLAKEVSELKPGTKISVVIVGISKSKRGVWAQPYPNITCFIPALELCQDDRILNALEAYFPVGTRLECIVMDKVAWRKRENWGSKDFQSKSDEVRRTTNKAETPYLSFLLAQGTTSLEKPKRGDIAIGRINCKLRLYRAPSLMLELRGGYHGRCCITELEEPDEWTNMPLGRQQSAMMGGEVTSPNLNEEDNVHSDDEAESDDDDLKERSIVSYITGEFVRCRVLESIPSDPVVEVSMRASRLDGDLEDDSVPQEGDTINAYVISTNKKGCFLRISRSIEGRVILKELADGYLHDPEALFPMGRLVIGKVKAVNAGKQKGKQKLAAMLDIDMRESQLLKDEGMLKLEDVKINEKYRGIVSRVEDYGVHVKLEHSEVCGLVHKSECSDGFIKEVKELYDPGDLVKVLVIKVDMDRRKIGLSMKASHFEGDIDSDDDISLEDSDAEKMDTDEDEDDSDTKSDDENYVSKLAKKMGRGSTNEAEVGDSDSGSSDEESDGDNDKLKGDDDESDDSSTSTGGELDSKEVMDTDVGFQWDAVPADDKEANESSSDESDDDMEDDDDDEDAPGTSNHSSRKKAASRRREEEEVSKREKALADGTADANPETAADYERLLASDPNNSEQWIRFMAFYLSLADMEGCRRVAKRALERIDFRQEGDKLNIWTALMTMELKFGGDFESTVEKACQQSNPKHVYLRACEILQKSGSRTDRLEGFYEKMCKRFRSKKTVWLAYLTYLLKLGRHHDAHALLKRALLSLPQYKHVETMSKLAQLEFEYGSRERGRTVFDGILSKYPKRLDILFVFVDKEIKCGELKAARSLLKKTAETNSKLNDKQMKKLFRKWMKIEEEFGDAETVETVKDAARAYVERTSK